MWFQSHYIKSRKSIIIDDLRGYVLPHAGTKHTGQILSHTLRFKPKKRFTNIIIFYYPAMHSPNISNKYYHEYYVPWKVMHYYINKIWKLSQHITFYGFNVRDQYKDPIHMRQDLSQFSIDDTLIVLSADFTHYLPMNQAIEIENCSAHSIMHRYLKPACCNHIDDSSTFSALYKFIPKDWMFQWIGRSRSEGTKAVGYLSFLIREIPNPRESPPDSIFITAYDKSMRQRECLGEYFDKSNPWSLRREKTLKNRVVRLGQTVSRLTNGHNKHIKITHYTITYLYKDHKHSFIRGWHGIKYNALYLPSVFLENTYENGKWITPTDSSWSPNITANTRFNLNETLTKLINKANRDSARTYELYSSAVLHHKI
jgi:hypothetical protein